MGRSGGGVRRVARAAAWWRWSGFIAGDDAATVGGGDGRAVDPAETEQRASAGEKAACGL
ncbi:hypothetical protein [Rhodococcus jostii]|uniref:hypothetical protein n=1 Tax=Rhodococcus jostii TaxID=132919 RepID=UPI0036288F26